MDRFRVMLTIFLCALMFTTGNEVNAYVHDDVMKNALPANHFIQNWVMKDAVVLYDKDTVFDHIDGEAELYFPYGFEGLATATYMNTVKPDFWVVVDIYRMGSFLDAFGIYSNYRGEDAQEIAVGTEGFLSSSQMMFYQDKYFVRIQATGTTDLGKDTLLAFGRTVSKNLPANAVRPRELDVLDMPSVVLKSERYIAKSLLGYAFFRNGLIADATCRRKRVQIFIIHENSKEAAQNAFKQYYSYLKIEGKYARIITEAPDSVYLSATDPLYGGVFVEQSGCYVMGVIRLKQSSTAKQFIKQLKLRLE